MSDFKLKAGYSFPSITLPILGEDTLEIGKLNAGFDWKLVVVYQGKHCPICTHFLTELNSYAPDLRAHGIDVLAISSDPAEKAKSHMNVVQPEYQVGYDLAVEHMLQLGLYVSNPRSPSETDRPFAEPAIFVVNEMGTLQVVELANSPFIRPALGVLVDGLKFSRNPENNYPIRGTYE